MPSTLVRLRRRLNHQMPQLQPANAGRRTDPRAAIFDDAVALTEMNDDLEDAVREGAFPQARHRAVEQPDVLDQAREMRGRQRRYVHAPKVSSTTPEVTDTGSTLRHSEADNAALIARDRLRRERARRRLREMTSDRLQHRSRKREWRRSEGRGLQQSAA